MKLSLREEFNKGLKGSHQEIGLFSQNPSTADAALFIHDYGERYRLSGLKLTKPSSVSSKLSVIKLGSFL